MDEATLHDLMSRATDWRDGDPDPRTRAELEALVVRAASGDDNAVADLADRFTGPLRFGTAGLRGALGAGPNRMNRAVVITAAAGLVAHLRARVDGVPHLVVGYDARYGSATFARDTCAVAVAAGCTASLLPGPLPTPVLAFAVRHLRADAGVMVTASHNPPRTTGTRSTSAGGTPPDPPTASRSCRRPTRRSPRRSRRRTGERRPDGGRRLGDLGRRPGRPPTSTAAVSA